MSAEDLYQYSISLLPVKPCDVEFRPYFNSVIKRYYKKVKDYCSSSDSSFDDEALKRLKKLCDGLIRMVQSEYEGCRHSAFVTIKNQLEGKESKDTGTNPYLIKPLAISGSYLVRQGTPFYRMRVIREDERYGLNSKGMFHIPLSKKGEVKTQRYSVPGFPCLYLGLSTYGCWEEMRRPNFGTVMVSKYVSTQEFELLDLRIPSLEKWKENICDSILFFPLIIASMFQVKDNSATYKPEYLIPQLITEWVIVQQKLTRKTKSNIIGIIYTSVHKNLDFNFPEDVFDNIVVPVLKPLNKGVMDYCPILTDLFELTPPTYYDLETLKHGRTYDAGEYGVTAEKSKKNSYAISSFGEMERFLDEISTERISPRR